MAKNDCRMPNCHKKARGRGDGLDGFAGSFCSTSHELKYEHIKADAEDSRRAEMEQARQNVDKRDLPEYDGPPY
jgi:hypothetical protein